MFEDGINSLFGLNKWLNQLKKATQANACGSLFAMKMKYMIIVRSQT